MFPEISGNPNQSMYCDLCGQSEHQPINHDEMAYIAIYRMPPLRHQKHWLNTENPRNYHTDICVDCLKERYYVDDLVLAFYPEIADFINKDSDLSASARSVELPFDKLQSVVIIRQYEDYSKIPEQDVMPQKGDGSGLKPRVKVVTIQGRMNDDNENITFEVHGGFSPFTESPPSLAGGRPQIHMRNTKWVNLQDFKKGAGKMDTFTYNLFDKAGFDLLCEWAAREAREWLCHWHLDTIKKFGLIDLTRI